MQEKFDVALPDGCLLPQNNRQLLAVIQTVFMPGSQPYTLLINALTEENKDKFGSSEFEGLQFEIKRFDPQVLTGRLRITYQLRLTFSCSAIVNNLNNQRLLGFYHKCVYQHRTFYRRSIRRSAIHRR